MPTLVIFEVKGIMSTSQCGCGSPIKRPDKNTCLICKNEISKSRISSAKIEDYRSDQIVCQCSETVKLEYGSEIVSEGTEVCKRCYRIRIAGELSDLDLFSALDLPYELDPSKPQYKVITQKDRFFSSKFNPALIERALNEYAQEGWVLREAVSADFGSVGMSRNELILFMEKLPNGKTKK